MRLAVETYKTQSYENAQKRGAYPPPAARYVRHRLCIYFTKTYEIIDIMRFNVIVALKKVRKEMDETVIPPRKIANIM